MDMEDEVYQIYLEELKQITPCTPEEEAELLEEILMGGTAGKKRLIEGSLWRTLEYAKEFENRGLPMGDLIQEAGMALTLAVESYEGGAFAGYLEEAVKSALEEAVGLQKAELDIEETVLARVNVLKEVSQQMAEELGREATVEELAHRMKMTVDEIRDIMKLTLAAMEVSE